MKSARGPVSQPHVSASKRTDMVVAYPGGQPSHKRAEVR
jgi:hypothetical protein